jgi:CheY-like chemotaxis protein
MIKTTQVTEANRYAIAEVEYFVIHLTIPREEYDEQWELRRDLARLGGIATEDHGFAFATEQQRNDALEFMIDRWGPWYFASATRDETQTRLMVAVSDPDQQTKLGRYFRRRGFSVEVVCDALEALKMLAIHKPEVVVVDTKLMWGGGDGLRAYVRDMPEYRHLRFVVIGEQPQNDERVHCAAEARLGKTFQLDELLAAVRKAVKDLSAAELSASSLSPTH